MFWLNCRRLAELACESWGDWNARGAGKVEISRSLNCGEGAGTADDEPEARSTNKLSHEAGAPSLPSRW